MKVAIYVRVSSDRQAEKELSIPAQIKAIQQYCLNKGWIIINEYIEKGKSAKTDDRPEFQKMIAMAKRSNRPFEAVVVHKFDRFSRKRDDHVIYKALLNQCGVKVISMTEQTEAETPQDMLLEGMLEVISEFFNANLATEVRKGMTQNAKQGYNNGGTPPYGYRTEYIALGSHKTKAVWVLGPSEEIDTIRFIFNQYVYENIGYKKIANLLNEKGVPTQKGGKWSASTIQSMIHNESYIGRRIWNKQDYQTKGKKWRDRSEWVITDNAHPAIINEELFNLAAEKAKQRHNGGGVKHSPFQAKPNSPFWLRGVFYCEKCGSRMVGNVSATTKKYGGQKYYVCGGYMRKGKTFCPYVSWRKERIEAVVTNKLRNVLFRLLFEDHLKEELRRYHEDSNKSDHMNINNLRSEIKFLERRITQLNDEIADGIGKPYYTDLISEMEIEISDKNKLLEESMNNVTEFSITDEMIKSLQYDIQKMIDLLDADVQNPQLLNAFIGRMVADITVQRETQQLHLTMQLQMDGVVLFRKVIVAELE